MDNKIWLVRVLKNEESETVPTGKVDHDIFPKIFGNTFSHSLDAEELQAMLSLVVFGHKKVYLRKASDEMDPVKIFEYGPERG